MDNKANFSAFADWVIGQAFDGLDIDGGDIQEKAIGYGLLQPEVMERPCGHDC